MQDVKKCYQYITFKPVDLTQGIISLENKYRFINLNVYTLIWELSCDGTVIQSGDLGKIDLQPGMKKDITIPVIQPELLPGYEYFLNVSYVLTKDELWAKPGHVVASEQFNLPYSIPEPAAMSMDGVEPLKINDKTDSLIISGKSFSVCFNKKAGAITEYTFQSVKLIHTEPEAVYGKKTESPVVYWDMETDKQVSGPILNIYRAPIDNDIANGRGIAMSWIKYDLTHLSHKTDSFSFISINDITARVSVYVTPTNATGYEVKSHFMYTVYGNGIIKINSTIEPCDKVTYLPRVGHILQMSAGFEYVNYFGAGPFENYRDRMEGADIGLYKSTVSGMEEYYPRPQDMGNRGKVRWFSVTNWNGTGLMFVTDDSLLNFSTLHYRPDDLAKANYPYQLKARPETIITIDVEHMGLGSAACGPMPLNEYQLKPGKFSFEYEIRLYTILMGDKAVSARKVSPE